MSLWPVLLKLMTALAFASAAAALPPGLLDVFKSGTEGYGCYRIPVLLRLPDGNIAL